jgi:hypothetical protein
MAADSIHARKVLLHAVNRRHGTDGFICPPKEVGLRIFITLKNPSTSAGIEPANLGSSGEHRGRRKPKYSGKNLSQCHFDHHKSHMD